MDIYCCTSSRLQFESLVKSAGKMTSCKKYLELEAVLGICHRYRIPLSAPRSPFPQRKRARQNPHRRRGHFCFGNVTKCDIPLWRRSYGESGHSASVLGDRNRNYGLGGAEIHWETEPYDLCVSLREQTCSKSIPVSLPRIKKIKDFLWPLFEFSL